MSTRLQQAMKHLCNIDVCGCVMLSVADHILLHHTKCASFAWEKQSHCCREEGVEISGRVVSAKAFFKGTITNEYKTKCMCTSLPRTFSTPSDVLEHLPWRLQCMPKASSMTHSENNDKHLDTAHQFRWTASPHCRHHGIFWKLR